MNWATLLLITVLLTHTLTSDASDVIDDVVDDEEELEEEEMVIPDAKVNLRFNYHNYTALTAFLNDVAAAYPQLTQLYSIGKSVQGRELWVLAVSSTPHVHVAGKPEVKYVGNIHGNEPVSKEILLQFIMHLVTRYGYDDIVTLLLNRTRIHFLASMNPDGFEKSIENSCKGERGRKNNKGLDLNRNFPDYFQKNNAPIQPETRAVIRWMSTVPFVLSAGLHGGALVASYPYENNVNFAFHVTGYLPHLCPDDDVFRHLAEVYARNHATMWKGQSCKSTATFPNGIINGAQWYTVIGGMQDYNYIYHGTMEITLEVSCCKHPPASALRSHWLDNKEALMAFVFEALRGVKGYVTDEDGNAVKGARLAIKGRSERPFHTTSIGEYWRILLNGTYTLLVSAEGYGSQEVVFDVSGDEATELNVTLRHPAVSTSTTISSIRTTLPTASASTFSSGDELRSGRPTNPTNPAEIIPEITVMVDYDVIQTDYDIEFDDIRMGQAVKSAGCVVWRPPILLLFLCHISFRLL